MQKPIFFLQQELSTILGSESIKKAPILILANKQDIRGAMETVELTEALQLSSIKSHDWHVQAASATRGEGLMEGLEWLS